MRATIVHNPHAGGAQLRQRQFDDALRILRDLGWSLDVRTTHGQGTATALATQAVRDGTEVVVAAGGDGTINEVIQALACTRCALGCLPLGTVNVWAREVGYPLGLVESARAMANGRSIRFDLGRVDGRYFLLMLGVGLDGAIAASVHERNHRKQRLGVVPYVLEALATIPRYRGSRLIVELDGRTFEQDALMAIVSNTRLYGGIAELTPDALANDGQLDVRIFSGRHPAHAVRHISSVLVERVRRAHVTSTRASQITIHANPPAAIQIDGEPAGTTPISISVKRQALVAIVPPENDQRLIGS